MGGYNAFRTADVSFCLAFCNIFLVPSKRFVLMNGLIASEYFCFLTSFFSFKQMPCKKILVFFSDALILMFVLHYQT